MDPMTIMLAVDAAKTAIDGAIQLKEKFFTKNGARSESENISQSATNFDALQSQLVLHKEQINVLSGQLDECRAILEKQNEIIIELSNALKVTAETTKNLKKLVPVLIGISALSLVGAVVSAVV